MTYKILSTSPSFGYYAPEPVEYLKNHGCEVELVPQGKKLSEEEIIEKAREADALIVGVEKISELVIEASKNLKIIAKHGAGVDNIDVEATSGRGIAVINAAGANSDAVADLTIGLFLSLARSIPFADRSIREGSWPRVVGTQFNEKILGIIGLGQIGKKVVKRASCFDIKILAFDIMKDKAFAQKWGINYLSLDELLTESDFVSIHIPLGPSTHRLIGEKELRLMKKGAFLVNISRGDIVDEEALYRALQEGVIGGAALDVFADEPLRESLLFRLDNVILTPHMGGYTYEALKETGMICARGIIDALEERQ
ncbi:MAG: hydroxyacid dehydrogenase [Dehalococcoidales bacterium]|jgi:D-3-phosphoglycerate dehydrogenase|nr:hydroxyacid dehydrogenase [Dehalococcoidales bacterium]